MAKSIMIQGTMSNAGKSLVTAGLCRVLVQDGYRVAPFKSQNMALNSFITDEGLEMGRAQVMQAEACKLKPNVRMNPILLKPTTDMGSQVIVNGEVRKDMLAKDYFKYKRELLPEIKQAYDELAKDVDIVVIEGAGSPAEINLKNDDIVNMGMANLVDAPVLLVGDIDRGGVFAQLAGTLLLLEEEEKARVKGLIINKFRGDISILEPGVKMLEEIANKEVVGVIPYADVDIEDEDSLSERFLGNSALGVLDIAVIRLPRISNFTDFNPLEAVEGVSLRYVSKVSELKSPDGIIIPGSKSTMSDLSWLRESGLEAAIKKCHEKGIYVLGICGGYQMLGMTITDEEGSEGRGTMRGMELLPIDTIFRREKTRTRAVGHVMENAGELHPLSKSEVVGYEIHMGTSKLREDIKGAQVFAKVMDETSLDTMYKEDGCIYGHVMGTYLHGIFEGKEFTEKFLGILLAKKGLTLEELAVKEFATYKEEQYDKLADIIRASLDMKKIYEIIGVIDKEAEK